MQDINKRTWAQVSIGSIKNNYLSIRKHLPEGCRFMGMVKSNAYGHGAVEVSRLLQENGCDYLSVACLDEALELRNAGISLPILVLGYTPAQFIEKASDCGAAQNLISLEAAREYSQVLSRVGKTLKIHIKLETGMGRTGFDVKHGDVSAAVEALGLPGLEAEGIFTHFAVADETEGMRYTKEQFKLFSEAVVKIQQQAKVSFEIKHCANSAAVINYPEMCLDMVRPGIALYGCYPGADKGSLELLPAMELKSRITQVFTLEKGECIGYGCTFTAMEKTTVAVLPIGYGDGLHRCLSGKIDVLINGRRCPQIGRICMDMCMADVSDCDEVKVGDIAVIFGHDGEEFIPVEELAEKAGSISYEMFCALSPRVPRIYCK